MKGISSSQLKYHAAPSLCDSGRGRPGDSVKPLWPPSLVAHISGSSEAAPGDCYCLQPWELLCDRCHSNRHAEGSALLRGVREEGLVSSALCSCGAGKDEKEKAEQVPLELSALGSGGVATTAGQPSPGSSSDDGTSSRGSGGGRSDSSPALRPNLRQQSGQRQLLRRVLLCSSPLAGNWMCHKLVQSQNCLRRIAHRRLGARKDRKGRRSAVLGPPRSGPPTKRSPERRRNAAEEPLRHQLDWIAQQWLLTNLRGRAASGSAVAGRLPRRCSKRDWTMVQESALPSFGSSCLLLLPSWFQREAFPSPIGGHATYIGWPEILIRLQRRTR